MQGTRVQELTAAVDSGKELSSAGFNIDDIPLLPYVAGWKTFKKNHVSHFTWVEQPLIHTTAGYAGTVDRVLITTDGESMLVDPERVTNRWSRIITLCSIEALPVTAYAGPVGVS